MGKKCMGFTSRGYKFDLIASVFWKDASYITKYVNRLNKGQPFANAFCRRTAMSGDDNVFRVSAMVYTQVKLCYFLVFSCMMDDGT